MNNLTPFMYFITHIAAINHAALESKIEAITETASRTAQVIAKEHQKLKNSSKKVSYININLQYNY